MARDGCNFYFSFWAILSHSTSLTAWKTEIKKNNNKKEILEISSFYLSVWKTMIICYNVPEIWHLMDVTFIFSFWAIFCTFTPLKAQKTKSQKKKKEKNTWRYHHFTQMYQKLWSYAIMFLRYGAWQMQILFFT